LKITIVKVKIVKINFSMARGQSSLH